MSKKILSLSLSCLLLVGAFQGTLVNAKTVTTKPVITKPVTTKPVTTPTLVAPSLSAQYTLTDGFENNLLSSSYSVEEASVPYAGGFSSTYAASGASAYRFEVRKTDPTVSNNKRSEISLPVEKALQEHWYTVSIYLPKGGTEDFADDFNSEESLFQWHNVPDAGGEWTVPPLALIMHNGNWAVNRHWDPVALSTDQRIADNNYSELNLLGSYAQDKGKWVTWSFHVKWGWLASQKPILEVYKNGTKVLDRNGLPNTMNAQSGVYTKFGIYKWDWMADAANDPSVISKRVVYYDNFSIK